LYVETRLSGFPVRAQLPPQNPLTAAQERALVGLAELCPGLGEEASAADIAKQTGSRHGATTLALRGLERRRLVTGHGSDPRSWAPTLTGRALAKTLIGRRDDARHSRQDGD
jgi:hypothetical protein